MGKLLTESSSRVTEFEYQLYFLWRKLGVTDLYTETWAFKLADQVEVAKFQEAISLVIEHNTEIHSNYFLSDDSLIKKEIRKDSLIHLIDSDLYQLSALIEDLKKQCFDLEKDPLIQFYLFTDSASQEHYLLINSHHILTDSITKNVLLKQLFDAYETGSLPPKTEMTHSQQPKAGVDPSVLERYKAYLGDMMHYPDRSNLYGAIQEKNGGVTLQIDFSQEFVTSTEQLCRSKRVTPFAFYLTAFYSFLCSQLNTYRFRMGIPFSSRANAAEAQAIGYYVNTLPFGMDLEPISGYDELLKKVQMEIFKLDQFKSISPAQISDITTSQNGSLYKTVFSYQETHSQQGIDYEINTSQNGAKFELTANFKKLQNKMVCELEFSDETWTTEESNHFKMAFENWVLQLAEGGISWEDAIKQRENDRLVFKQDSYMLSGEKTVSSNSSIYGLFNAFAAQSPYQQAIIHNESSISYKELNDRVLSYSRKLACLDITSSDIVALRLKRSIDTIALILALAKNHITHVHLSDMYPAERTSYILKDSQAQVLIFDEEILGDEKLPVKKMTFADFQQVDIADSEKMMKEPINQVFSLIYTSGTTGTPKGVKIKTENIQNFSENYTKFGAGESDIFTHLSTYTFDAWFFEVMLPILNGKCIVIVDSPISDEQNWEFAELATKPTIAFLTTSLFNSFTDSRTIEKINYLNKIVIGGETASPKHIEAAFKQNSKLRIFNGYGPTENTTFTTVHEVTHQSPAVIPIGTPLTNMDVIIVGPNGEVLPKNCYGEIFIAGRSLMAGYLGRGKDKLVAHQEGDEAKLYYQTGDIGKVGLDNQLNYLYRKDRQVKIRGFRIELSEIEHKLSQLNGLTKCVAQVEVENAIKRLVVYYTGPLSKEKVKLQAESILPAYMMPNQFIKVNEIKLTLNGKMDKSSIQIAERIIETKDVAWSDTEKIVLECITKATSLDCTDKTENFYTLGIDSISSLQVCSILRSKGIPISVSDFFQHQTIESLAYFIENQPANGIVEQLPVEKWESNALSPIQKWFFDTQPSAPSHWNQSILLKMNGEDELLLLKNSLRSLIDHFEILKSVFEYDGENWRQVVKPNHSYSIHHETNLSESELAKMLAFNQQQLDLKKQLYRFSILETGSSCYVQMVIHHLIIDGVSWRMLLTQFSNYLENNGELVNEQKRFNQWIDYLSSHTPSETANRYWNQHSIAEAKAPLVKFANIESLAIDFNLYETKEFKEKTMKNFMGDMEAALISMSAMAVQKTFPAMDPHMTIQMEGHGRPTAASDFSSTLGWFTTIYPIALRVESSLQNTILKTREILSEVPNKGFDFSLAHSMQIKSDWTFNFMGDFNSTTYKGFEVAEMFRDDDFSEASYVSYNLQLVPIIIDETLSFKVFYNNEIYNEFEMSQLLGQIKEQFSQFIQMTPDRFLPLSGTREGMLIQQEKSSTSGNYVVQWKLNTPQLDINQFQLAVQRLIYQVEALRSTFRTVAGKGIESVKEPEEIIQNSEIRVLDWSKVSAERLDSWTERYLKVQRATEFDFEEGPLFRFTVIKTSADYLVIFEFHHIILDGWSMSLLFNALTAAYEDGGEKELNSYVKSRMNLESIKTHVNYEPWQQVLANYQAIEFFGNDSEHSSERIKVTNKLAVTPAVNDFLKQQNITMNEFYLLAWSLTVAETFGKKDVLFGMTVSGRNTFSMHELDTIGMFISTLPVRIKNFDTVRSVKELLDSIKENVKRIQDHDYVSWLDIAQHFNENSEIQIGYVFENYPILDDEGIFSIKNFQGKEQVEFPLALSVTQQSDFVTYELNARRKDVSEDLLMATERIFKNIVEHLPLYGDDYLKFIETIRQDHRTTARSSSSKITEQPLQQTLSKTFSAFGENIFVRYENRSYSYLQIQDIIAKVIGTTALCSEDTVLVATENRFKKTIYLLACLVSGATYVPVSKEFNQKRVEFIAADSGANCLFDESGKFKRNGKPTANHDAAYIIYTSGTTGVPKGVVVTADNLSNFISSMSQYSFITEDDIYYQNIAMTFDPSIMDILLPFQAGASIYIPAEKLLGKEIEDCFNEQRITIATFTPSLVKNISFLQATSIKTLFVGGEALKQMDINHVPDHIVIVNMYGPTEATITSTLFEINQLNKREHAYYPIGKPLKSMEFAIRSEEGIELPVGSPGLLYLKGPMIAKAYTDSKLTDDYFSVVTHEREYNTGDIVYQSSDGNLHYVCRKDQQIKLRGYRIELKEIEGALANIQGIIRFHLSTVNQGTALALFYSGDVNASHVKANLQEQLPAYMVPAIIKPVADFPLSINGKIDVKQLQDSVRATTYAAHTENRNSPFYEQIKDIWAQVLELEGISKTDNFFELGGNSLLAIQAIKKVNEVTGANVSIKTLFEYQVIGEFVEQLRKGESYAVAK
ncbi:condensation domain-containing protein [Planococcus plakortidis]